MRVALAAASAAAMAAVLALSGPGQASTPSLGLPLAADVARSASDLNADGFEDIVVRIAGRTLTGAVLDGRTGRTMWSVSGLNPASVLVPVTTGPQRQPGILIVSPFAKGDIRGYELQGRSSAGRRLWHLRVEGSFVSEPVPSSRGLPFLGALLKGADADRLVMYRRTNPAAVPGLAPAYAELVVVNLRHGAVTTRYAPALASTYMDVASLGLDVDGGGVFDVLTLRPLTVATSLVEAISAETGATLWTRAVPRVGESPSLAPLSSDGGVVSVQSRAHGVLTSGYDATITILRGSSGAALADTVAADAVVAMGKRTILVNLRREASGLFLELHSLADPAVSRRRIGNSHDDRGTIATTGPALVELEANPLQLVTSQLRVLAVPGRVQRRRTGDYLTTVSRSKDRLSLGISRLDRASTYVTAFSTSPFANELRVVTQPADANVCLPLLTTVFDNSSRPDFSVLATDGRGGWWERSFGRGRNAVGPALACS